MTSSFQKATELLKSACTYAAGQKAGAFMIPEFSVTYSKIKRPDEA